MNCSPAACAPRQWEWMWFCCKPTNLSQAFHVRAFHMQGSPTWRSHVQAFHVQGSHTRGSHMQAFHMQGSHMQGSHVWPFHVQGSHLWGSHVQSFHMRRSHEQAIHMQCTGPGWWGSFVGLMVPVFLSGYLFLGYFTVYLFFASFCAYSTFVKLTRVKEDIDEVIHDKFLFSLNKHFLKTSSIN